MTVPISPISSGAPLLERANVSNNAPSENTPEALGLRFEQMLWAEMLSHAGLEKAMTLGGGEGASAFSRYVVESIAADLAEKQPLGIAEALAGDLPPTEGEGSAEGVTRDE